MKTKILEKGAGEKKGSPAITDDVRTQDMAVRLGEGGGVTTANMSTLT